MIRENKLKYLISSIIILLPFLVSLIIKNSLESMVKSAWHFTWIMPVILFALHTGLLILTRYIDPIKQSKKVENMIFFTIPAISLYTGAMFIAIMLGLEFNIGLVCSIVIGVSFIIMGNYLPKAKRNRTYGIKIKWALANDDNWVATHRLGGKLFVIAGLIMLFTGFLPTAAVFISLTVLILAIAIIPSVYSYHFYKRQIESGEATEEDYKYDNTMGKKGVVIVVISAVVISALVLILMISGNLKYRFTEDALEIKPSFGGGIELEYSELKDAVIEYREAKVPGTRAMGYGSPRLLYGQFKNEEFGMYTRYTYTKSEAVIIIYLGDEVVVIADETTQTTRELYEKLVERVNRSE